MTRVQPVSEPEAVAARIRAEAGRRHLLVLLDFDGTLCGFASDPQAVVLTAETSAALDLLAASPDVTLGIVSGRPAQDVLRRLPPAARLYAAGVHGLEIEWPGGRFVHEEAARSIAAVQHVAQAIAPELERRPGVFVEDKGMSIALHVRAASAGDAAAAEARFRALAAPALAAHEVRILEGACVVELLPGVPWNKGDAVAWIRARVERERGAVFTVFAGDDITDEDAFRAVGAGLAIAASDRPSGADCRLEGPEAITRLLQRLAAPRAAACEPR
jgi:trehalose-phosphatase